MAAWGAFLNDVIAPSVVDPGFPVFEPSTVVGKAGESTQLGGYSIVTADDLERSGALSGYYLLPATRADQLRRLGRNADTQIAYKHALELAPTEAERRYLQRRIAETTSGH